MNKNYIKQLETTIQQMLKPLKSIPFNLVIRGICGKDVISFSEKNKEHKTMLEKLENAVKVAGRNINKNGIFRKRANEVGNDIELFVRNALIVVGIEASVPNGLKGNKKTTGYPDLDCKYNNTTFYLECKTYNVETNVSTLRSFYLSPSKDFKVTKDALHMVVSFELLVVGEKKGKHIYKCKSYKILSLDTLEVDVKYEFNSDNNKLYSGNHGAKVLSEGIINLKGT